MSGTPTTLAKTLGEHFAGRDPGRIFSALDLIKDLEHDVVIASRLIVRAMKECRWQLCR